MLRVQLVRLRARQFQLITSVLLLFACVLPADAEKVAKKAPEESTSEPLVASPAANALDGFQLVWADEFNDDGAPSKKNWRFENGFVRNKELQWYQPKNAQCEAGVLIIEARREHPPNRKSTPEKKGWISSRSHAEYTSACLTTRGLHSWTFGRIEVRAKLDARPGLWPAIWTVGEKGPWPEGGEVDLMECYDGHLLANACWSSGARWKPTWDAAKIPLEELGPSGWAGKYHVWRMDWNAERINLLVDDQLLNTIDLAKTSSRGRNPFHEPQCLMLNLAVGGTKGGDPSATTFPAKFEVDYVRVYQRSE